MKKRSEELGRPLFFRCVTFGCQMNARDSEKLEGILEAVGYRKTDSEEADFVIYNTCTVRENANLKVYGHLGQLGKVKEETALDEDCPLRLYDAGTAGGGETEKKLPVCGSDFRDP